MTAPLFQPVAGQEAMLPNPKGERRVVALLELLARNPASQKLIDDSV